MRLLLVVGATFVAGCNGPDGQPATAAKPPLPYQEAMIRQQPLKRAASLIRWEIERGGHVGFMSLGLADDHVVLRWKGQVPAAIQRVIAEASAIAPIEVVPAGHSRRELQEEVARVGSWMRAGLGGPVHTIRVEGDGSGLRILTDVADFSPARHLPAMRVPYTVQTARPMRLRSRLDDSEPWRGGARIQNETSGGDRCTAGFGVEDSSHTKYILTAGHCGKPGDHFLDATGEHTGWGAREHREHDILLYSSNAQGRIYDGGVVSDFTKGVAGWDWVFDGELLCTSGSFSGVICGLLVDPAFIGIICGFDVYDNFECWDDLLIANQVDGKQATLGGDSGGPVFTLSGAYRVVAKGTITGQGTLDSEVVFQDFGTAFRDFGVVPIKSPAPAGGSQAAIDNDGTLDIFQRRSDGALWHNRQLRAGGSWGGWSPLQGVLIGPPSVGVNGDGRLEAFVRGTDNALWHTWQRTAGGSWSSWVSRDGQLTTPPLVQENHDSRLEVFGRGTDNALWHIWQLSPGGAWSRWESLGGILTSAPGVFINQDGRIEVFVRGATNDLWHIWQVKAGGAWSKWESLGGGFKSGAAVGINDDGRLEIFARGLDDALWHDWQLSAGGVWSGWNSLGGGLTTAPVVGLNADGRLEVFVRGLDNAIWHIWQVSAGGVWSRWDSLRGALQDELSVKANADGRLEIFDRGLDGTYFHDWQVTAGGTWSGWFPL
jgi:hypothetical protein